MNHDELWRRHALCATHPDPDLWFPEKGRGNEAKAICAGCPVRVDCLRSAIADAEEHGVWAGAGEPTRRYLRHVLDVQGEHQFAIEMQDHFDRLDEFADTARTPEGAAVSYGAGARCGTASKYGRGCRCDACRQAKMESLRRSEAKRRGDGPEAA